MRPAAPAMRNRQRGVALLLVLWASTLLAILLGGYAVLARTEGLQARYEFARTQAYYAAQAGLMQALYQLHDAQPKQRWVADGRTYTFKFGQARIQVSAVSENGKVDLNAAAPQVLQALFTAAGLVPEASRQLAARVVDWRQPAAAQAVGGTNAVYQAAGRHYGPRHAPFASIEELQMVLGMTPKLYQRLASQVTIWSGKPVPDQDTAPRLALLAIPGMSKDRVQALLAARRDNANPGRPVIDNGLIQSFKSTAALADGTEAQLRATIRLRPAQAGAQPYMVLRWREGTAE